MAAITADDIRSVIAECRKARRAREVRIEGQRGLYLRVTAEGVASWSLVYRVRGTGKIARYFLGRYPDTKIKDARDMAAAWMPRVDQGIDPRDVRREEREQKAATKAKAEAEAAAKAARLTVAQAVDAFLIAKRKNKSVEWVRGILQANLVKDYGEKALADLTRADVEDIHNRVVERGAPRQADNVLAHIRSLLSWASKPGKRYVTENVASKFERAVGHGEGIRHRKLTAAEIRALWLVLERDDTFLTVQSRRIMKLALLLGSRAGEVAGMRLSELSDDIRFWTIPPERMKAKRVHVLPLPPAARSIIIEAINDRGAADKEARQAGKDVSNDAYLFTVKSGKPPRSTSLSHSMKRLQQRWRKQDGSIEPPLLSFVDAKGKPSAVKMHDLRRTLGTGLQHLGVTIDVVKAVLAHSALDDVTRTHYAQSPLGREVHEALVRWQATVTAMVRGGDPFAIREEDFAEKERRLLGQDLTVTAEVQSAPNVVPLRAAG